MIEKGKQESSSVQ